MKIALNETDDKLSCIYTNLDKPLSKACRNNIICFAHVHQRSDAAWFISLNPELTGPGSRPDCDIGLCSYATHY